MNSAGTGTCLRGLGNRPGFDGREGGSRDHSRLCNSIYAKQLGALGAGYPKRLPPLRRIGTLQSFTSEEAIQGLTGVVESSL